MGRYKQEALPLVNAFEGFHDLEDDDGDEDEEEYRLSWDISSSDDDVDEPVVDNFRNLRGFVDN
jgi:hypothetical protein